VAANYYANSYCATYAREHYLPSPFYPIFSKLTIPIRPCQAHSLREAWPFAKRVKAEGSGVRVRGLGRLALGSPPNLTIFLDVFTRAAEDNLYEPCIPGKVLRGKKVGDIA